MGLSRLAVVVLALGALGGCQELYGGKPERLHNPEKKRRPAEAVVDAAPEIKYVEDCSGDFRKDPRTFHIESSISSSLTADGDTAIQNGDKAKDPKAQSDLFRDGIDKYRNALVKDPYNSEATLKLAVAYDKVYRKGCALLLLHRLASLASNPRFAKSANQSIEAVGDNAQWFKGYRKAAIDAVGR